MAAVRVFSPTGSSFVSCHCLCGASGPASSWYHGLTKCPKGAPTPQDWLDSFKVTTIEKPVKGKGAPKKSAESSSKASTPTKDGENAGTATASDEEPKHKAPKKQKVAKEDKEPKAKKTKKADDDEKCEPKEKRPASAYFIFSDEKRKEAKEANAEKPLSAKELGEMWKALSEEDKAPFNAKAADLKAAYDANKPPSKTEQKKAAKAEGPAKAKSAYILFTMAKRAEVLEEFPGIQAKEVMKLLGGKWKELSAEDKAVYDAMAKAEKEALATGPDKVDDAGSKRKSPEKDEEETESSAKEADDAEDAKTSQADDDKDEGGDEEMKDDTKEEGDEDE